MYRTLFIKFTSIFFFSFSNYVFALDDFICKNNLGAVLTIKHPEFLGTDFSCALKNQKLSAKEVTSAFPKLDSTPNVLEVDSNCPSTSKLIVNSSGYSGQFLVELRSGTRPGSRRISGGMLSNGQELYFSNICPGKYFYAFGPTDNDDISVTRYFQVVFDGSSYSNPELTIFYSRLASNDKSRSVEKVKKKDL